MTGSPWNFNLSDLSTLSSFPVTVQVSLLWQWFPQRFLLVGFQSGKLWFSVFTRLSLQFWGQQFALCVHTSLINLRRVDFSVCLAFYLLGLSCNFQVSYMLNWKLELSHEFLWVKALSSGGGGRQSIHILYLQVIDPYSVSTETTDVCGESHSFWGWYQEGMFVSFFPMCPLASLSKRVYWDWFKVASLPACVD